MGEYVPLLCAEEFQVDALYTVHYFEYSSDYCYSGESHDFWEFCYVDKGEIEVLCENEWQPLKKGQVVFHQPMEFHSLKANGRVAPNLVVVSFGCASPEMEWFRQKVLSIGEQERALLGCILEEAEDAFLSPLNDPDLKELTRRATARPGAEQMVKISLEALLIGLYRKGTSEHSQAEKPGSLLRERSQKEQLDTVLDYFDQNLHRQLTLTEICKDNLIGRSNLQKIFREKTGGGAIEYFSKMKIEAAKQKIREGRYNFTEISTQLGYSSIHYFSRHFKKTTGMTLSEYASSVKVLTSRSRLE